MGTVCAKSLPSLNFKSSCCDDVSNNSVVYCNKCGSKIHLNYDDEYSKVAVLKRS